MKATGTEERPLAIVRVCSGAANARIIPTVLQDDPITVWLNELREDEESAAQKIWDHYVKRLYDAMRRKIHPNTRRVYDEEDAAQSAFQSLCRGIRAGRFPDLKDRLSLWRLLLVIASRKISMRHRYDQRDRRDVRRTLDDSIFLRPNATGHAVVDQLPSREPTPEFAAEFVETCGSLFEQIEDPRVFEIARLKIEGYSDDEVAERVNCSRRTVQRKIEAIRRNWTNQLSDE